MNLRQYNPTKCTGRRRRDTRVILHPSISRGDLIQNYNEIVNGSFSGTN